MRILLSKLCFFSLYREAFTLNYFGYELVIIHNQTIRHDYNDCIYIFHIKLTNLL